MENEFLFVSNLWTTNFVLWEVPLFVEFVRNLWTTNFILWDSVFRLWEESISCTVLYVLWTVYDVSRASSLKGCI